MYDRSKLVAMLGFTGYYIDPINLDIISFKRHSDGYPLKWFSNGCIQLADDSNWRHTFNRENIREIVRVARGHVLKEYDVPEIEFRDVIDEEEDEMAFYLVGDTTHPTIVEFVRPFEYFVTENKIKKIVEEKARQSPGRTFGYFKKRGECSVGQLNWKF